MDMSQHEERLVKINLLLYKMVYERVTISLLNKDKLAFTMRLA